MAIYKSKFTGEEIDSGISIARTLIYLQDGEPIPEEYRDNLWQYNLYWQGLVYRCIREESPDLYYEAYDELYKKHRKIYIDMSDWTWDDETNVDVNLVETESGTFEPGHIVIGDGSNYVRTTRFSMDDIAKNFNTEPTYTIECTKSSSRFRVGYNNLVSLVHTGQQAKLEIKTVDNYTKTFFGFIEYDVERPGSINIQILPKRLDLMTEDLSNIDTQWYFGIKIKDSLGKNILLIDINGNERTLNDYDGDYSSVELSLWK